MKQKPTLKILQYHYFHLNIGSINMTEHMPGRSLTYYTEQVLFSREFSLYVFAFVHTLICKVFSHIWKRTHGVAQFYYMETELEQAQCTDQVHVGSLDFCKHCTHRPGPSYFLQFLPFNRDDRQNFNIAMSPWAACARMGRKGCLPLFGSYWRLLLWFLTLDPVSPCSALVLTV